MSTIFSKIVRKQCLHACNFFHVCCQVYSKTVRPLLFYTRWLYNDIFPCLVVAARPKFHCPVPLFPRSAAHSDTHSVFCEADNLARAYRAASLTPVSVELVQHPHQHGHLHPSYSTGLLSIIILQPYVKVVTHSENIEWWIILMVDCVTILLVEKEQNGYTIPN